MMDGSFNTGYFFKKYPFTWSNLCNHTYRQRMKWGWRKSDVPTTPIQFRDKRSHSSRCYSLNYWYSAEMMFDWIDLGMPGWDVWNTKNENHFFFKWTTYWEHYSRNQKHKWHHNKRGKKYSLYYWIISIHTQRRTELMLLICFYTLLLLYK